MSRVLSPNTVTNINADVVKPFFAVELKFDGTVIRLWTGVGTLVLPDGTNWIGTGAFLNISSIEETSEMAVKGAIVTLSGIPSEVISLALQQPYQGRVANIYFGTLTDDGFLERQEDTYILLQDGSRILLQLGEAGFNELFSGYMDQMNIEDGPETSTIELSIENKLIDLERPRIARFTSAYQESVYAGDVSLRFLESMQGKPLNWGGKS